MRTRGILLAGLAAMAALAVGTTGAAAQSAAKSWTQEERFRRNVGTREDQLAQFPPHTIIGNIHFIDPAGSTAELDAVEGLFLRVLAEPQAAAAANR